MYDVIIIGGGPAGMAAAIYAARKKLELIVISPDIGGQTAWAPDIENYLGYSVISGMDLSSKFEEHIKKYNIHLSTDRVSAVETRGNAFLVKTKGGNEYESRTVISCTGRSARSLGVPGEEEYRGKGVAYCATCDAPLFADEDVAVVGSGNAGLESAIQLIKIAKKVYLIEALAHVTGDPQLQDHINNAPNARILLNTEVLRIAGTKMVEGIVVRNVSTGEEQQIPLVGVFIEIGSTPNTSFLPKELKLNTRGEVEIDCTNSTNIPGLFAAGDATDVPHKQIIIAAGEGAKALLTAYDYLIRTHSPSV